MAASLMSPYIGADEISLADAVLLFERTGHPIAVQTLTRQCRRRGVTLVRRGQPNYASWSDLLEVHAAWVEGC